MPDSAATDARLPILGEGCAFVHVRAEIAGAAGGVREGFLLVERVLDGEVPAERPPAELGGVDGRLDGSRVEEPDLVGPDLGDSVVVRVEGRRAVLDQ